MLIELKKRSKAAIARITKACQTIESRSFVHKNKIAAVDAKRDVFSGLPGVASVKKFSHEFKLASREFYDRIIVNVDGVNIGAGLTIIAGPCAVESYEQTLETARAVKAAGARILRGGAFKPRTSPYSFQGLGERGLEILANVSKQLRMPFVSEVLGVEDVEIVANYAHMLQVGARNMQNVPLLRAVGRQEKPVLLKRGFGASIDELLLAAEYIMLEGNHQVVLCERGIKAFEKYTRYTPDLAAIPVVKELSCLPIIFDPSHSLGIKKYVPSLALAAVACGADGLIIEVHKRPEMALSDRGQQLTPEEFGLLMRMIKKVPRPKFV